MGDNAKIGGNAVVIKPVPEGATAVGIPARIIMPKTSEAGAELSGDAAMASKFSAYGITNEDDPVSQAMKGLIETASAQDRQIAMLWQAIEKIQSGVAVADCVPTDAAKLACFEADKMSQLVGK